MKKTLVLLFSFWITLVGFSQTTFTDVDAHEITEGDWYCFPITVSGVGTINDNYGLTQVCVKLEAETDGDISMALVSPDGTQILLTSNNGADGNDYYTTCFSMFAGTNIVDGNPPFEGDFIPEGDLGLINNFQNGDGQWRLCIRDENSNGDNVTLQEWALTFDENPPHHITRIMHNCEDDNAYFYDLAGDNADYGSGEVHYWVICSEDNTDIGLYFEEWDVEAESNDDRLIIWNSDTLGDDYNFMAIGDGRNSLLHTTVRADNPTGCLTLRWVSDGDDKIGEGWKAKLACYLECQKVEYVWDESVPSSDTNYIAICQGQEIIFNAHGVYPENDNAYHQKDETSTFIWSFGDGQEAEGTSVQHIYNGQQGYNIELTVTDTIGCQSHLFLDKHVMISLSPSFNGTHPVDTVVCVNSCTQLVAKTQTFGWADSVQTKKYEDTVIDTLKLADVSGGYYYSYLDLHKFNSEDRISSGAQLDSVLLSMEHSYIGDLIVWLVCPNGAEALLFDGNEYGGGKSTYLGIPYSDDRDPEGYGEGWDYIFSTHANYDFNDAPQTDEKIITLDGRDEGYSVLSGTYQPRGHFDELVGCPLNGTWTMKIQDDQSADDGYLFKWTLWFNDTLYNDASWGYHMTVDNSLWSGFDVENNLEGDTTKVCVPEVGDNYYTYTITDQFGCSYDTVVKIKAIDVEFVLDPISDASCGEDDGEAEVTDISGGSGYYVVDWSNGEKGLDADSLFAGAHSVQVSDTIYGCMSNQFFNIDNTDGPSIFIDKTDVTCYDEATGSATVNISGGNPPYVIEWSTGSEEATINHLAEGTYFVTVTDDNACMITQSIEINQPNVIQVDFDITNSSCGEEDGAISIDVSGGTASYTYAWSTGATTANIADLGAGSYSLMVEDANHCKSTFVTGISDVGSLEIVVDSTHSAGCGEEGGVFISVNGGSGSYSYEWSNGEGSQDLDGFAPGDYQLKVTDGSCVYILNTNIPYIYPPQQSICMLTVDTITGTNRIVWSRGDDHLIDHYNIYREGYAPNEFLLIATVDADELTEYNDTSADPYKRSWRYKISTGDACGNESVLSDRRTKTIHLNMNVGLNDSYNLIWDDYEGFDYTTFYIYRITNDGVTLIDSLPSNLHSYTDVPPTKEGLSYFITVRAENPCVSTSRETRAINASGGPYYQSTSNIEDEGSIDTGNEPTSVQNLQQYNIQIYPNPTQGQITVQGQDIVRVEISTVNGQKIKEIQSTANYFNINIKNEAKGLYFVKVTTKQAVVLQKIILE